MSSYNMYRYNLNEYFVYGYLVQWVTYLNRMWYKYLSISSYCPHSIYEKTDRQTDTQTDRQTDSPYAYGTESRASLRDSQPSRVSAIRCFDKVGNLKLENDEKEDRNAQLRSSKFFVQLKWKRIVHKRIHREKLEVGIFKMMPWCIAHCNVFIYTSLHW